MTDVRKSPIVMMAWRNVTRTQLRSAFAVMGIIVGVLAIASLGIFGASLERSATASFDTIGSDLVVSPAKDEGIAQLSDRDLGIIQQSSEGNVVPFRQSEVKIESHGEKRVTVAYGASNPGLALEAAEGQIRNPHRNGVLVGANVAEDMNVRPGDQISVGGQSYVVRAVLERHDQWAPVPTNDAVILPLDDVGEGGYDQILVREDSREVANTTSTEIRERLNGRQTRVSILEMGSFQEQVSGFFEMLNYFLIGIGSISLVVAGVSILNIMMMSVVERREEIGVLRAVGYHRRDIIKLILVEAAILGVLGGIVGTTLSVLAGLVINWTTLGDPLFTFTLRNLGFIALAFGFAVATSMVSGAYPAWKAANERPVEVLRS